MALLLTISSAAAAMSLAPPAPPPMLAVQIDWPSFLARSDMEWEWNTTKRGEGLVPVDWWNSAFLGNGNLGLQVVAGLHDADRLARPHGRSSHSDTAPAWHNI